jgi:hypothetical protein
MVSCISIGGFAQTTQEFDYVSPFHEDFAAVKKGDQWGFINMHGDVVVDFRDDLVTTKTLQGEYPIFMHERCLIVEKDKGISYYGYIDTKGKSVVNPEFLKATNFKFDYALVLKVNKEKAGYNNLLDKDIVYYTYTEVIIDVNGTIITELTEPKNIVMVKKFLKLPAITSELISNHLVSVKTEDGTWLVQKYRSIERFESTRESSCVKCGGSGVMQLSQVCPRCKGSGLTGFSVITPPDAPCAACLGKGVIHPAEKCTGCNGSGTVVGVKCNACNGLGRIKNTDGSVITCPGCKGSGTQKPVSTKPKS